MLSSGSCLGVTSRPHRLFIGRPGAALIFYQIPGIIAMTEKLHCDDSPPVITEKIHCDDRPPVMTEKLHCDDRPPCDHRKESLR